MPPVERKPRSNAAALAQQEAKFIEEHQVLSGTLKSCKKGCHKCGNNCIKLLDLQQILTYRRNFRRLPNAAQDRELIWIFGGAESGVLSQAGPLPEPQAASAAGGSPQATSDSQPAEGAAASAQSTSSSPRDADSGLHHAHGPNHDDGSGPNHGAMEVTSHDDGSGLIMELWRLHPPPVNVSPLSTKPSLRLQGRRILS